MTCRATNPVQSEAAQATAPTTATLRHRGRSRSLSSLIFSLINNPNRPSTPVARVTRYSVDSAASLARSPAVGIGSSTKTPSRPRYTGTARRRGTANSATPATTAVRREEGVEGLDKIGARKYQTLLSPAQAPHTSRGSHEGRGHGSVWCAPEDRARLARPGV